MYTTEEVEIWDEDDLEIFDEDEATSSTASSARGRASALVIWLVYCIALIQKKHFLPDSAVSFLLLVLWTFLGILGRLHPQISKLTSSFPSTLHKMHLLLSINAHHEGFIRFVVCPKCNAVYHFKDCIDSSSPRKKSKRCWHRDTSKSPTCSELLLKSVETTSGKIVMQPFKIYCYRPLRSSLQELLNRPNFQDSCEKWRTREVKENLMGDIYDAKIWDEFQECDRKPFLSQPFAYGLMLNVDWFRPFKHTDYSLGAIYLSVMNLPRELRFKQENIILIGLIPGPHEPSLHVNSILKPLVTELLDFMKGIQMTVNGYTGTRLIRCALLSVACDIPACRKISGFLGHSATLGCSKCLKKFPGGKDMSGFDRSKWPARTVDEHRKSVKAINDCEIKSHCIRKELELGCRYSVLLDLPYFDPVRMSIIDPMHNLYLGTAKYMLKKV